MESHFLLKLNLFKKNQKRKQKKRGVLIQQLNSAEPKET